MKFILRYWLMSHILAFFLLLCDRDKGGEIMRNRIYLRPTLYDLSQGTRIKFVRVFRHLTQDNISNFESQHIY